MNVYTSYYANPALHHHWGRKVSISNTTPDWFPVEEHIRTASPDTIAWRYKEGLISEQDFESLYRDKVTPVLNEVISKLKENDVLLCYEKTGKFCHRNILATILRENGISVQEL